MSLKVNSSPLNEPSPTVTEPATVFAFSETGIPPISIPTPALTRSILVEVPLSPITVKHTSKIRSPSVRSMPVPVGVVQENLSSPGDARLKFPPDKPGKLGLRTCSKSKTAGLNIRVNSAAATSVKSWTLILTHTSSPGSAVSLDAMKVTLPFPILPQSSPGMEKLPSIKVKSPTTILPPSSKTKTSTIWKGFDGSLIDISDSSQGLPITSRSIVNKMDPSSKLGPACEFQLNSNSPGIIISPLPSRLKELVVSIKSLLKLLKPEKDRTSSSQKTEN